MFRKLKEKPKGVMGTFRRVWAQVWRTIIAGMLVWIPLLITLWVTWFFVNRFVIGTERLIRDLVGLLNDVGAKYSLLSFLRGIPYVYGIGVAFVAVLFLGTGVLTRHLVGRRIIAIGERFVQVIPFVNRIYRAVQQIRDTFMTRQGGIFQRVCVIQFPHPGMYAIAFVTAEGSGLLKEFVAQPLVAVFIPTTPNPTSGYLIYVSPEEVHYLDISVEEAMKVIVSGGAYLPPEKEPLMEKEASDSA